MSFGWYLMRPVELKTRQGDSFWVSHCDIPTAMRLSPWGTFSAKTTNTTYVRGNIDGREHFLHRLIINPPGKMRVDHIDGNGMNCVRYNMRICTNQQNMWNRKKFANNTSGYIGVSQHTETKNWCAKIRNGRDVRIGLGSHSTPEAAARAYDAKCRELRGEFAVLNFPDEGV